MTSGVNRLDTLREEEVLDGGEANGRAEAVVGGTRDLGGGLGQLILRISQVRAKCVHMVAGSIPAAPDAPAGPDGCERFTTTFVSIDDPGGMTRDGPMPTLWWQSRASPFS
jgi:hypothetical protein